MTSSVNSANESPWIPKSPRLQSPTGTQTGGFGGAEYNYLTSGSNAASNGVTPANVPLTPGIVRSPTTTSGGPNLQQQQQQQQRPTFTSSPASAPSVATAETSTAVGTAVSGDGGKISVAQFMADLKATLASAASDLRRLGVEGTVMRVLCDDVNARIATVILPKTDASLLEQGRMPDDVISLQHKCEDLHGDSVTLQKRLNQEQVKVAELAHKLDLRNNVVEELRKQSHSLGGMAAAQSQATTSHHRGGGGAGASVAAGGGLKNLAATAVAVDFLDAVEKESASAALKSERHLAEQAEANSQSKARHQRHYEKLLNAKESEIVQIQLRFRNTLKSIQGTHAVSLDAMAAENAQLKKQVADATQVATQKAELMMEIKLEEAEYRIRQECAATVRAKQNELEHVQVQLSELQLHCQTVEEEATGYWEEACTAQREVKHLVEVEHKVLVESYSGEMKDLQEQLSKVSIDASKEAATLQEKLEKLEAKRAREVGHLTDENGILNSQVHSLRQDVSSKEITIKELAAHKVQLQSDFSKLREENADLESELAQLRKQSTDAVIDEWSTKLTAASDDYEERIALLHNELSDAQKEAETYKRTSDKFEKQLEASESRIALLERELQLLKRDKAMVYEDLRKEKLKLATSEAMLKDLEAEVASQHELVDALQEEILTLKTALANQKSSTAGEHLGSGSGGRRRSTSRSGSRRNSRTLSGGSSGGNSPNRGTSPSSEFLRDGINSPVQTSEKSIQVDDNTNSLSSATSGKFRANVGYTPSVVAATINSNRNNAAPGAATSTANSASAEARTNNARIRCELVETRLTLRPETQEQIMAAAGGLGGGGSHLLHGGVTENKLHNPQGLPEYDPIPLTHSQLEVIRQNQRMSVELGRRKVLLDLERSSDATTGSQHGSPVRGPRSPPTLSPSRIVSRVDVTGAGDSVEVKNLPRDYHHKQMAHVVQLAEDQRQQKHNDDEDEDHEADQFVPGGLGGDGAQSTTPNVPPTAGGEGTRSYSAVPLSAPPQDYNGYIVRVPYKMLPSSNLHLDRYGHNSDKGVVAMGSGFRKRPQTARTARRTEEIANATSNSQRASPRATQTAIASSPRQRAATEHTPLNEMVAPTRYFQVTQFTTPMHQGFGENNPTSQQSAQRQRPQSAKTSRGATQVIAPKPGGVTAEDSPDDDFNIQDDRSISASPDEDGAVPASRPPQANLVVSSYTRSRHQQKQASTTSVTAAAVGIQKSFASVMNERRGAARRQSARK